MTALEKMRNEFISKYPKNYAGELELGGRSCVFSLKEVLEIIDKYAERQKCGTCRHNETEFCICQYCTSGNKYEERCAESEIKV